MCEWVFELGRSANLSFKGDREKPCRFWNAFFVRMLWLFRMFSVTVSRPLNSTFGQNMDNENIISALELFNEKASKLGGSNFLKKAALGQIVRLKPSLEFPIEVVGDGPDQENIDAFVLTFRFFIQNNEASSFANLSKIYESASILDHHRTAFQMVRRDLNNYLDGPCAVVEAHGIDTKRKVMEIFIFGGLSHAHKDRKHMYDKWINDDRLRPLILLEFVLILRTVWAMIDFVAGLNNEVIKLFQGLPGRP